MKATGHADQVAHVDPLVALNEHTRKHIDHWLTKFPPDRKRSALIQSLFAAQEQNQGFLTDELIVAVARYLQLPEIWAYEVASFYSMLETRPVGRNNVAICTNVSCWLKGAEGLVSHCEKKLGIKLGESTPDGRIYLKEEQECIAACAHAPAMTVNGHYHERLSVEAIDQILDGLK
ncbi:NADH-quinone oxidoreductase subunit NuoE [Frateuria aurantia]|uniref:NADH-quinone oxidoreductase subunit E n=1 Tax=Frateuria aurantia (strain ATCC 33424 / DSM 6220 / KCTC 2777 / LMG 1558 / NBRC 3245 / NCIMB 13370) TaxID=767434 RepID=H8L5U1_FRAAD|nr:NADH-quinone oxidoreductase subunit NuoE [Frateuria aurantia]AFC85841.1 NADH-quinone oxidoreductase, E subunit [Frateuria aurantia DSM 6220]